MIDLSTLTNTHRPKKKIQRVGRGCGSKRGKTSQRGHKGYKSRSGYTRRYGHEGGQLPLYRKLPCRGFTNGRFTSHGIAINLSMINSLYNDGETVNLQTLREKGYAPRRTPGGLKVLGGGEVNKKVKIEAHFYSETAKEKLQNGSVSFKEIQLGA